MATSHWRYARLALVGIPAYYLMNQGYFLIIGKLLVPLELGGLRAAHNLMSALSVVALTFENHMLPRASAAYHTRGIAALHAVVGEASSVVSRVFPGVVLACVLTATLLFNVIYAKKFDDSARFIVVFGLYQYFLLTSMPAQVGWSAQGRLRVNIIATISSALVSCLIGIPLTIYAGAGGAALGFLLSGLTLAGILTVQLERQRRGLRTVGTDPGHRGGRVPALPAPGAHGVNEEVI